MRAAKSNELRQSSLVNTRNRELTLRVPEPDRKHRRNVEPERIRRRCGTPTHDETTTFGDETVRRCANANEI
ncbi:hypothetical protein HanRHA438_Chr15g0685231 [Helianthus annuus]|nr:hypothetical protein HanHA300_Chr15g0549451 [Helianthus annuus]KAJ0471504.1 hypothetical protein HanHA89_Chr15g0596891 [Helianthus annuus]KAJ0647134.1 hypothetical protein HanLR1_Chr15g0558571 [Helianthus annuus]KAJ0842874.1 hypothetical protein HanRHA438_Chr15g0685231 [Helianthus annuus]